MRSRSLATVIVAGLAAGAVTALAPPLPATAHELGTPTPIGDLNQVGAGLDIGEIRAVGTNVFFTAATPARGTELWFSDGTAAGTKIVKDIYPGPGSSAPHGLIAVGTGVFFAAATPDHGTELWRSDGTLAGTTLVADVRPGPDGSDPTRLVTTGSAPNFQVFFAADDGVTNEAARPGQAELWGHSTQAATTTLRVPNVTGINAIGKAGNYVYFAGRGFLGDDKGEELWRYDGGASWTQTDLYGGGNGSPRQFTTVDDTLFFAGKADAGPTQLHRIQNADAAVPGAVEHFAAEGFAPGRLTTSGSSSHRLWYAAEQTDGAVPVLYSVNEAGSPAAIPSRVDPVGLVAQDLQLNDAVWFNEETAQGRELGMRSTVPANFAKDIVAGPISSSPTNPMPVDGGVIVYRSLNGMYQPVRVNLADGAITEFPPFAPFFVERDLAQPSRDSNGGWYFEAASAADGGGLWHFNDDGTLLTKITGAVDETAGSGGNGFTAFGDLVAFSATDGVTQPQPWAYDPAAGTATQLTGPNAALSSANPGALTAAGGRLFASAELAAINTPRLLWASDGTAGGTSPVSGASTEPTQLTAFANGVLYQAITPAAGAEPWFSDGTSAGTVQLGDLVSGPTESDPASFVALGDRAVFQAEGGGGAGHDLWGTDGTPAGTQLLAATDAGFTGGAAAAGRAFYGANAAGVGVWASDGTVDGTTRIALHPNATLDPAGLIVRTDGSRVFVAGTGELWVIDAASGAATQIALPAGTDPDLRRSGMAGSRFVFSATTPAGTRLFALDGATATELDPAGWGAGWALGGGLPFVPFASHHEYVYFVARNDALGLEVWQSDGTAAGTRPISDINPGAANTSPTSLTVIGERLYFSAVHPDTGREPYFLEFQPHPPEALAPIEPARYWDTRAGEPTFDHLFEGTGFVGAGQRFEITIAGRGNVPADAAGVAANLTVIQPDGAGFATLFPCTPDVPKASHVNYLPGDILANNVVVPLSGGKLCVFTKAGADFALDVNGYVPAGSPVVGFNPARFVDTRTDGSALTFDGASQAQGIVPAEGFVEVQITGRGGLVPAGAQAVFANVTAVGPQGPGYLRMYPCGPLPATSTLNYAPGETVPNGALAALSPTGSLCVMTKAASHVIVDIAGYVPAGAAGLVAIAPERFVDTRPGLPLIDGTSTGVPGRLAAETQIEIKIAGRGSVPAGATAGLFNLTVVAPDGTGFAQLFPCGPRPQTSNVNHARAGIVKANNALTKLSPTGTVCVFAKAGTDIVLDVTGWVE